MLQDPREDHTSTFDADAAPTASARLSNGPLLNGGSAGSRLGPIEPEAWLGEAVEALPRAIYLLPDLERRLVVGSFYDQRPVEELARELRLPPDHATAILGDALRTLRVKIGG